jgi:CheY-like chemotaxis protein
MKEFCLRTQQPECLPKNEPNLSVIHVLVVDDELANRDLLTVILSHYGFEVTSAKSAKEALAQLESFVPDVLISDIGMPDMDGCIFLQTLRSRPLEKGGKLPAIALSAYTREQDVKRALDCGFQQYLKKPVHLHQLVQAVESLAKSNSQVA